MTEREAKRQLLEHLRRNIESLGLKGALATQLGTSARSPYDRVVDALYDDLRAAGVPLPEIVGPTFEVLGYAAGAYEMQCHVSYSLRDPDRYDVAIQGPTGLSRAFKFAPQQCGRLFLFDRNDVINPQKK